MNQKHIDENGNEFWFARELMPLLEYSKWENFNNVIQKAVIAYRNSNNDNLYWLPEVRKPIITGKGKEKFIKDYKLSRYICYLIVQNANPSKKMIAYQRNLTKKGNYSLNQTAKKAGVKNFDKFHNAGYKDLNNGETADDIAKRKGLRYREDILDNMGSEELADNLFRIVQTEAKLKKENIISEVNANNTHYEVGNKIRNTIKELGGTMPEDLLTPEKSLKELEKEQKAKLINNNNIRII